MGCELVINHCRPSTPPGSWYRFLVQHPIDGYQLLQDRTHGMPVMIQYLDHWATAAPGPGSNPQPYDKPTTPPRRPAHGRKLKSTDLKRSAPSTRRIFGGTRTQTHDSLAMSLTLNTRLPWL
ncbi:hypothetical protein TNCV_4444011 [Trichonephila clavipes]|nr:hypothetical protein TNCV_4444011 [Trichonephila clavipes]